MMIQMCSDFTMTMNVGIIFIAIIGLSQTMADSVLNRTCLFDLFKADQKHSMNLSVDAEVVYEIYGYQNGCIINVDEIYENITKHVSVNRTEVFVTVAFTCYYDSKEQSDIHFSSSGVTKVLNIPKISVQITVGICSIFMDELALFQKYGRIWSIVTTNSSQIYPGLSCSPLQDLTMLASSRECAKVLRSSKAREHAKTFFWEFCERPFEQLFNLRLQGCSTDRYKITQNLLQSKFPKLQTLWLKYVNLEAAELTFPWTNFYIDSSDSNIISYLSHYKESAQQGRTSITRSINIHDSDMNIDSNVRLDGYIRKIVISNVQIKQLNETIFKNVKGMVVLDVSNNKITDLDKNVFLMQNKLTQLHLSDNNLTTLPKGIFDDLTSLLYLDLSSNRITRLEQRLFKHLILLEELNLQSNGITTLPPDFLTDQIKSIRNVFLSKNPLETFPINVFYAPKVQMVRIRQCNISSSGITSLLENINVYELRTGYSESLTYDPLGTVGKQPLKVRSIDLTKNNIKDIPITLTKPSTVSKLRSILEAFSIIIDDNPLDCTCQMVLTTLLVEMYMQEGTLINWKCMYPFELRGRLIATIKPNENYCPVNVEYCPLKCACFERFGNNLIIGLSRKNRTFVIDCRNTNMTYMPREMPYGRLELWFKNASLVEVAPRDYLKNTTVFDASNNRINLLTPATAVALWNVSTLKLDHNNLTHLPEQIMRGNISLLTLSSNPYICDCNTKWMKMWLLKRTNPATDWNMIECTYNTSKVKQMISVPNSMFVCERAPKISIPEHVIFPSIIIGSILFVLVSFSLLFYFQRFSIKVLLYLYCGIHTFDKQNGFHPKMTHDAFILYSHSDKECIRTNLVEKLKNKGYRVADIYEDLIIGFSFLQNIERFINKSRRVIFCWTEDMLEDDFLLSAWNMVYEKALKNKMKSIILVVDNNLNKSRCNNENLRKFLKSGKFIKKQSRYMYASVEYLMPKTGMDSAVKQAIDENVEENTVPMLQSSPDMDHGHQNELVYLSYPDELDIEIRQQLIPYLYGMGHNAKVLDHDFTPGTDIRDEIHDKLDISRHFVYIISQEVVEDEVKMFILTMVMSRSMLCDNNYLLLFTSGPLRDVDLTNDLENYFNSFVTGSIKDPKFRKRLLQALRSDDIQDKNTTEFKTI
ncbi:protein toll-like [Mercenaria mercenaria]|uniref:protein toll-like n=1 Tax=Mercenaria mercenaria TaxID=6596 RepID=UPI00234F9260|nr:protein toll-like [Mercenaria mercenaria]